MQRKKEVKAKGLEKRSSGETSRKVLEGGLVKGNLQKT